MLVAGKTDLPYKQLQSDRGFLVYVTNAYPAMKPYLKGFHLSLDLWRGDRDAEGWTVNRANATDDNENLPSQDEDEEEEGRSVNNILLVQPVHHPELPKRLPVSSLIWSLC
jgi:hypothetical protein